MLFPHFLSLRMISLWKCFVTKLFNFYAVCPASNLKSRVVKLLITSIGINYRLKGEVLIVTNLCRLNE